MLAVHNKRLSCSYTTKRGSIDRESPHFNAATPTRKAFLPSSSCVHMHTRVFMSLALLCLPLLPSLLPRVAADEKEYFLMDGSKCSEAADDGSSCSFDVEHTVPCLVRMHGRCGVLYVVCMHGRRGVTGVALAVQRSGWIAMSCPRMVICLKIFIFSYECTLAHTYM